VYLSASINAFWALCTKATHFLIKCCIIISDVYDIWHSDRPT
jgi:hypothetical protein